MYEIYELYIPSVDSIIPIADVSQMQRHLLASVTE